MGSDVASNSLCDFKETAYFWEAPRASVCPVRTVPGSFQL